MSPDRRVRIGIDVGGTFTHAVAIDSATLELVGRTKVPTTHRAAEGVARGVVEALQRLLADCRIAPSQVLLIAHSTTQATNALLEGDVAPVGIVGLGQGPSRWFAAAQTRIAPIRLAEGRQLQTFHRFLDAAHLTAERARQAIEQLRRDGAQVIVAAGAFSVDDPAAEQLVCDTAAAAGLPATATHHVSRLHGLGVRTRTAVINASMVPKMLQTADMTEQAVRGAGIVAPLMIMRSDGGLMDIAGMRRRPILTMLSGPAAGVAAALLYARVSDGVFIEVGGTSSDISVIKNGRCQIRAAAVGGQKLHVSTLDVRTLGIAGGSIVTLRGGKPHAVGPRSAHIAGLRYLSFSDTDPGSIRLASFQHEDHDVLAVADDRESLALTPTCASNLLGLVPEVDPARGRADAIAAGFAKAGGASVATHILDLAAAPVIRVIEGLLRDYRLDPGLVRLVGGGGGAAAIVPYVAKKMGLPFELAENADVISAIGVALAMVRDTIERTVVSPTPEQIRTIREEAIASVLRMGAAAESVEVFVEVDAQRSLLRATAEGATEFRQRDGGPDAATNDRTHESIAAASLRKSVVPPRKMLSAGGFEIWAADLLVRRLWGFATERRQALRLIDAAGTIRWSSDHAALHATTVGDAETDAATFIESFTRYSDAGATIPRCFVLLGARIVDLSGLIDLRQVLEILRTELSRHAADAPCVLLLDRTS